MSGRSKYRPSIIDRLPARVSGAWAQEKLTYLARYMSIFNVAMKEKWHRTYLDLLAGSGRCIQQDTGEEFEGSPLRAIGCKHPFSELIFIEEDARLVAALTERVGSAATVINDNCNNPEVIARIRESLGYGKLGLAFIDNLGLDVPLSTIEQLTERCKVDLFIVFQIGDIKRNVRDVLSGKDPADRWNAFFGEGWKDVARRSEKSNASADETATLLLDFYCEQLGKVGYPHIIHSRRVMKNSRSVGLYRLILAGKHDMAVKFFAKVSEIDPSGQRSLSL